MIVRRVLLLATAVSGRSRRVWMFGRRLGCLRVRWRIRRLMRRRRRIGSVMLSILIVLGLRLVTVEISGEDVFWSDSW